MSAKIGVHTKEISMPFEPELGPTISISSYLAEVLDFDDLNVNAAGNVILHRDVVLGRIDRLRDRVAAL